MTIDITWRRTAGNVGKWGEISHMLGDVYVST